MSPRAHSRLDRLRHRIRRALRMVIHEIAGLPPEILDLTDAPETPSHDRHKEETEPCQDEDETKP